MNNRIRSVAAWVLMMGFIACGSRSAPPAKSDLGIQVIDKRDQPIAEEDASNNRSRGDDNPEPTPGRVFIAHDVNTLADQFGGRDECQFAVNVAEWLAGKRSGKILLMRSNPDNVALNFKQSVIDALKKTGFEVNVTDDFHQKAVNFKQYQVVFVSIKVHQDAKNFFTQALNNKELITYHRMGGSIYLAGGVGGTKECHDGNAWTEFLDSIGFSIAMDYEKIPPAVKSEHPIFKGIHSLHSAGSSIIINNKKDDPRNQILATAKGKGIFAIHDPSASAKLTKGIRARD